MARSGRTAGRGAVTERSAVEGTGMVRRARQGPRVVAVSLVPSCHRLAPAAVAVIAPVPLASLACWPADRTPACCRSSPVRPWTGPRGSASVAFRAIGVLMSVKPEPLAAVAGCGSFSKSSAMP